MTATQMMVTDAAICVVAKLDLGVMCLVKVDTPFAPAPVVMA